MEYVEKKVLVPKETNDLTEMLGDVSVDLVNAKRNDGKISQSEILGMVTKNITVSLNVLEGFDQIDDEAKNDPAAFMMAWIIEGQKVYKVISQKEDKPVEAPTGLSASDIPVE